MKLLLPLLLASALASAPGPQDPLSTITVAIPKSALELKLEYKQYGGDLKLFTEDSDLETKDLRPLRVKALLVQGGKFSSDVSFKIGEKDFAPGEYPFGYTVGVSGALHMFIAEGEKSVDLASEAFTPGWKSERVQMQLVYVGRAEARIIWHVDEKAGVIKVALGPAADAASEPTDDAADEKAADKPADAPAAKPASKPAANPPAPAPAPKSTPKAPASADKPKATGG